MKPVFAYLPFLISFLTGYFSLCLLFSKTEKEKYPTFLIRLFLSGGLGLGISAQITFLSFVIFDKFIANFLIFVNVTLLSFTAVLYFLNLRKNASGTAMAKRFSWDNLLTLSILIALSIPLWYQAHFYAFGGWDAWQAWNLKARMMFLGGEHWKNMLLPIMWRSSPHYPLLLPSVNVWGWVFLKDPFYKVPAFTAFIYTFLTVGLLCTGLKKLTKSSLAILPAIVLLTSPIFTRIAISQYADILISFYLLASIYCLVLAKLENERPYVILAGIFLSFLAFTKPEGLVCSLVLILIFLPYLFIRNPHPQKFRVLVPLLITLIIAFIPCLIFQTKYSPGNQSFINGLTSSIKPAGDMRLKTIGAFYYLEVAAPIWNLTVLIKNGYWGDVEMKWHGMWLILALGFFMSPRRSLRSSVIIIPVFLLIYWSIVTFYYYLNTFFAIDWWLQVTLHRILFTTLPLTFFWIFWALWSPSRKS